MKQILGFYFIILQLQILSQTDYGYWKRKADSFYLQTDYIRAGNFYQNAFKKMGNKGYKEDRIRYIHSAIENGEIDSAFSVLEKIVFALGMYNAKDLEEKREYIKIRGHRRWHELLSKVKIKRDSIKMAEATYNWHFIHEMNEMVVQDQKFRKEKNWDKVKEIDNTHYPKLVAMFQRYGFLNYDIVGESGSNQFWLLVQHQDEHPRFQDSVLLEMKKSIDRGKASKSNYAYLTDRVLLAKGRKQRYGTQMNCMHKSKMCEPMPLEDPIHINMLRAEMGLGTIEDYIRIMNERYLK